MPRIVLEWCVGLGVGHVIRSGKMVMLCITAYSSNWMNSGSFRHESLLPQHWGPPAEATWALMWFPGRLTSTTLHDTQGEGTLDCRHDLVPFWPRFSTCYQPSHKEAVGVFFLGCTVWNWMHRWSLKVFSIARDEWLNDLLSRVGRQPIVFGPEWWSTICWTGVSFTIPCCWSYYHKSLIVTQCFLKSFCIVDPQGCYLMQF